MSEHPHPTHDDPDLEARLAGAWDVDADLPPGRAPREAIAAAMGSVRRTRRRRLGLAGAACVLLAACGLWLARGDDGPAPTTVDRTDAAAYGNDLWHRVMHDRFDPNDDDPTYLRNNEAARAEYLAALDHPSSFVRRVALDMLTFSGIEVPQSVMLRMLTEHREDLERPLMVAEVGDAGRVVAEAIEARRTDTVVHALLASFRLAAGGKAHLPAEAIEPWLGHEDKTVRGYALHALRVLEDYTPSETIWRMLREDPYPGVRKGALRLLAQRLGGAAHERLLAWFRDVDDPTLEPLAIFFLREATDLAAVVRTRLADGVEDPVARAAHGRYLLTQGDPAPAAAMVEAILRSPDEDAVPEGADLVARLGREDLRPLVVAQRARVSRTPRRRMALRLLAWDLASGDRTRILDVVREIGTLGVPPDARLLEPLREHADPAVRAAAAAAIAKLKGD